MDNKEICSFVNSKDIRHHLMTTGYEFTTIEAAWLVYRCRSISLDEKIEAWERIIETMPDQKTNDRHSFSEHYDCIHEVLRDYISLVKESLAAFLKEETKAFYQYKTDFIDYRGSYQRGSYDRAMSFSSYKNCLSQLKKELSADRDVLYGTIRRSKIDSPETIEAEFNRDTLIKNIDIPASVDILHHNLSGLFECQWFYFPVPFQKGDILYDPYHLHPWWPDPVVMTDITPLLYETRHIEGCDTSDMNVFGYFQNAESGIIYHEVAENYMDYEYFPEENLKGVRRILKALSSYIKDRIPIDTFIYVYHMTVLEEAKNNLWEPFSLTDEEKEACGI